MTPGGTRYQDGVTKPLVARVAELEEKLVQCSMENATAKQVRWPGGCKGLKSSRQNALNEAETQMPLVVFCGCSSVVFFVAASSCRSCLSLQDSAARSSRFLQHSTRHGTCYRSTLPPSLTAKSWRRLCRSSGTTWPSLEP